MESKKIPSHLADYVVDQEYGKYTFRNHAVWRFIMRQSVLYFSENAHESYLKGLEQTAVSTTRIPKISEMDESLAKFGWGAVCVRGFIPPSVFLMFQSSKLLPIAADMRTINHLGYTPAPDIVHEAAGHAPIVADPEYAEYLTRYANLASHAICSDEDLRLYEAIRELSDLKENPDSSQEQIDQAEREMKNAYNGLTWLSEAAKVARMSWWTIEYGLIGDIESPKIYGAGLLSSVAEAKSCLSKEIPKIPLSIECINQAYDITEPQPQLFVAKSFEHMFEVLQELEETMAFNVGGIESVKMAIKSKTVNTVSFDHGSFSVSGVVTSSTNFGGKNQCELINWDNAVQVCIKGIEVENLGVSQLNNGVYAIINEYKSPIFPDLETICAKGEIHLEIEDLQVKGKVNGTLKTNNEQIIGLWIDDLTVKIGEEVNKFSRRLMLFSHQINSVFGGPEDWEKFGRYNIGQATTLPGRQTPYTDNEKEVFGLYKTVREWRENGIPDAKGPVEKLVNKLLADHRKEWLLVVEILELENAHPDFSKLLNNKDSLLDLLQTGEFSGHDKEMIELGLNSLDFFTEEERELISKAGKIN